MMNNFDLRTWVEAEILACDRCGATYDNSIIDDIFNDNEETKCNRTFCFDGIIKRISPFLLPAITLLNAADLIVTTSYVAIFFPLHIDIVINFRDIYGSRGNQLKAPPTGFELVLAPDIELSKRIAIKGKSDCGILEEIQSSINDLCTWAKECCNDGCGV